MKPTKEQLDKLSYALGDTVDLGFAPWGNATIIRIESADGVANEYMITLFRPFVSPGEFVYVGNRINAYIGIEQFTTYVSPRRPLNVIDRRSKLPE